MLFALVLLAVAALLLLTDAAPRVAERGAPSAEQVSAGRNAAEQIGIGVERTGVGNRVRLGVAQFDGLSALASHGFRPDRLELGAEDGVFRIEASHALPLGRWLNIAVAAHGASSGFPPFQLSVGALPLSPWLSRKALDLGRWLLVRKGATVPPLDDIVNGFAVDGSTVTATIRLPWIGGLIGNLTGAEAGIAPEAVAATYCRLARAQAADPQPDLAVQVRRAFPASLAASATPESNRAAFVALAMFIVDPRVGSLAAVGTDRIADCAKPGPVITLHGRDDLPKHWALSAALAAATGTQMAESMGEWKELADSLARQSYFSTGDATGFSFVDLSADRSGFRVAAQAFSPESAPAIASRLARATDDTILPRRLLLVPDSLKGAQFRRGYGGINDPRFAGAVRNIDAVLDREGLVSSQPD